MSFSDIKVTLKEAERSQSMARDSLVSCPDIPEEVRRCLAHLFEANELLGGAVKLLVNQLDPSARHLADLISTVAEELATGSDHWKNKQLEMQNFVTLLVELGHEGEFSLADLRDIAKEAGVLSAEETKMKPILNDLRGVGALAGPNQERLYRLGKALIV